jgi:hypothetical protein
MGKTSPESDGMIAGVYFAFPLFEEYVFSTNAEARL